MPVSETIRPPSSQMSGRVNEPKAQGAKSELLPSSWLLSKAFLPDRADFG